MGIDATDPNLLPDPGEITRDAPAPGLAPAPARARERAEASGLTVESRRRIGRNLRLLYDEVLEQPLPDRFGALLADLAARGGKGGSS